MTRPISDLPDRPIVDETAKTWRHLPPVFCGERVPPFPADKPLPEWPVDQSDISTADLRPRSSR